MGSLIRDVLPLLAALAFTMMGNALLTTLLGIEIGRIDASGALVGVVMAGYYVGFLACSLLVPILIRRAGHVRAFMGFALLGGAVPVLHALAPTWIAWFLLRGAMGITFAGIYVVVESWLNQATGNEARGRLLALYMVVQGGAWSTGQFLLNVADAGGWVLFVLASGLLTCGAVVIAAAPIRRSPLSDIATPGLRGIGRLPLVGIVGCVGVGAAQGAVGGVGAIYAHDIGLDVGQIAWLFGLSSAAATLVQWPMGWISDRVDRRRLGAVVAFGAILGALVLASGWTGTGLLFFVAYMMANALSFSLYALYLAIVNDQLGPEEMAGASGNLMLIYALGAVGGPVAGATAMVVLGSGGLFLFLGGALLPFAALALVPPKRRA